MLSVGEVILMTVEVIPVGGRSKKQMHLALFFEFLKIVINYIHFNYNSDLRFFYIKKKCYQKNDLKYFRYLYL